MLKALLVDTTYLLPIFGIRVDLPRYEELFPKLLSKAMVFYNPISLIEIKWIALKLAKKLGNVVLERYRIGLRALLNDDRLRPTQLTNHDIETVADSLIPHLGDYFDRLIVATAYVNGYALLTEDRQISELAERGVIGLEVVSWDNVEVLLRE